MILRRQMLKRASGPQILSAPSRQSLIDKLKKESFDVLIIGGGATGSGCALDGATRGLKTALVERSDFAAGTSGRSTKLIHGGIRYLETAFKSLDYASYKLVQEALEERAHMLNVAPYMNRPLPIMIPLYNWFEVPYMWVGAKVYDLVAHGHQAVPSSHWISTEEAMYQFPMLRREGLKGAVVYYDGQMNDTRMAMAITLTAIQSGAVAASRVEVIKILKDENGKTCGARMKDLVSGDEWDVQAKVVINATGPFSDSIRKMDDPEVEELIIPAAGVHVVLPDHFSPINMGLIVPKTQDGRVLFFLPWQGATIAGTTDSQSEITMTPSPSSEEVSFIIEEANRYLDKTVSNSDVRSAWSGIRPLAKDPAHLGQGTSKISREHVVEVSKSNLVTIGGGKWTTYRRMAQDAVDKAVEVTEELQGKSKECSTSGMTLIGADRLGQVCNKKFDNITVTLREKYGIDRDVAEHLVRNYGTRALQIAETMKTGFADRKPMEGPHRLVSKYPFLEEEVVFAVRQEYALEAVDVICRRTRLGYIDSHAAETAGKRVVELMAKELNWSSSRKEKEMKAVKEYLATFHNA